MAAAAGLQGAYLLERISYLIAQIETTIASIMQKFNGKVSRETQNNYVQRFANYRGESCILWRQLQPWLQGMR